MESSPTVCTEDLTVFQQLQPAFLRAEGVPKCIRTPGGILTLWQQFETAERCGSAELPL